MLVEAGKPGTRGLGVHNHDNPLGLELWMKGNVLFADPGAYVYTSDWHARELFRSIRSHNTVEVEKESTGNTVPTDLFRLNRRRTSHEQEWASDSKTDLLRLERVEPEFSHLREIRFNKEESSFEIQDELNGERPVRYLLRFHLGPGIGAEEVAPGRILLLDVNGEKIVQMDWLAQGWSFGEEEGWLSDGYGRRRPGRVLLFRSSLAKQVVWRCRIQ